MGGNLTGRRTSAEEAAAIGRGWGGPSPVKAAPIDPALPIGPVSVAAACRVRGCPARRGWQRQSTRLGQSSRCRWRRHPVARRRQSTGLGQSSRRRWRRHRVARRRQSTRLGQSPRCRWRRHPVARRRQSTRLGQSPRCRWGRHPVARRRQSTGLGRSSRGAGGGGTRVARRRQSTGLAIAVRVGRHPVGRRHSTRLNNRPVVWWRNVGQIGENLGLRDRAELWWNIHSSMAVAGERGNWD